MASPVFSSQMKDEIVDDGVIKKVDFFNIDNTTYHSQQRKNLRFYENRLYYMSNSKVSVLNLENGEITENIIPDFEYPVVGGKSSLEHCKKNKVTLFMKTKSYFIWSHESGYILFMKPHDSEKIHHTRCQGGYQFNEACMTEDEKTLLTCGQTSILSVYKVDRESGMKLFHEVDLGSYGNDVKFSKDERHVCVVTDGQGFQVFKHNPKSGEEGCEEERVLTLIHGSNVGGCCDMCEWSPDSKRLIVANSSSIVIFNVETIKIEHTVKVGRVSWVKWSPVRNDIFLYALHSENAFLVKIRHHEKIEEEEEEEEEEDKSMKMMKRYSIIPYLKKLEPSLNEYNDSEIPSCEFSTNGDRIFISYRLRRGSMYYFFGKDDDDDDDEKDLEKKPKGVLAQCFLSRKFRSLKSMSEKEEKQYWIDFWERRNFLLAKKEKIYFCRKYNVEKEEVMMKQQNDYFGLTICLGGVYLFGGDGIAKVFLML